MYRSCQPGPTSSAPLSVNESRRLLSSQLSSGAAILNPSSGSTISAWALAAGTSKPVTAGHDLGGGVASLQLSKCDDDNFDVIIPTPAEAGTANFACKDHGGRVCSGSIDSLQKDGTSTNHNHKLSPHQEVRHRLCPAIVGVDSGKILNRRTPNSVCRNDDQPSFLISARELLRADQQETATAAGVRKSAADHNGRVVVDRMKSFSCKDLESEACYNNFGGIKRTFIPAALRFNADCKHHQAPHAAATSCDSSSSSDHDDAIVDRLRSSLATCLL